MRSLSDPATQFPAADDTLAAPNRLPLEAAARLAREHGLVERLYPLFEPAIVPYLLLPAHRPQTSQLVATARARRALLETANDEAGSVPEIQADMQRRQVALDAVLQRLEDGLRGPGSGLALPDCDRPTTATSRLQSESVRRRASTGPSRSYSADPGAASDPVRRHRHRSASVAISRRDAIRGSTSTTISSLGTTTRVRRDSDDASSTCSRSSSSSFSGLEFTPLESDVKQVPAGVRSTRWSPVTSSYTLVLAPDAASTSSVSTLHSVPGPRSRTVSGVGPDAGHGPAAALEADHRVLATSAEASDDVGGRPLKRCRAGE